MYSALTFVEIFDKIKNDTINQDYNNVYKNYGKLIYTALIFKKVNITEMFDNIPFDYKSLIPNY